MKDPRLGEIKITLIDEQFSSEEEKLGVCAWCKLPIELDRSLSNGSSWHYVDPDHLLGRAWVFHPICADSFHAWGMVYFSGQLSRNVPKGKSLLNKRRFDAVRDILIERWEDTCVKWYKWRSKVKKETGL